MNWTRKYQEHKSAVGKSILFFRIGDFYELFGDDARIAAKVLGLTLTTIREQGKPDMPMAGVPYNFVHQYVNRLRDKGYEVVIGGIT